GRFWYKQAPAVVDSRDGQTGRDGNAVIQLSAEGSGSMEGKGTAKKPEGREIESSNWLWISRARHERWQESQRVQIIPDKKSYKVGDVAHVMVMTNVPQAQILVTTEGRTIQTKQVVKANGPSVMVNVPIRPENQPNVFVSAAFVRDNTLFTGSKNL